MKKMLRSVKPGRKLPPLTRFAPNLSQFSKIKQCLADEGHESARNFASTEAFRVEVLPLQQNLRDFGHGIVVGANCSIVHNLPYPFMFTAERKEGEMCASSGAVAIDTGIFTGRSPNDKYYVNHEHSESAKYINWDATNQPMFPHVSTSYMKK